MIRVVASGLILVIFMAVLLSSRFRCFVTIQSCWLGILVVGLLGEIIIVIVAVIWVAMFVGLCVFLRPISSGICPNKAAGSVAALVVVGFRAGAAVLVMAFNAVLSEKFLFNFVAVRHMLNLVT